MQRLLEEKRVKRTDVSEEPITGLDEKLVDLSINLSEIQDEGLKKLLEFLFNYIVDKPNTAPQNRTIVKHFHLDLENKTLVDDIRRVLYAVRLINEISKMEQQEVRWHIGQMFSYLELDSTERDKVIRILFSYIDTDKSKIVKVCSMQTLADLADKDESIRPEIMRKLNEVLKTGSPAIVNRCEKLIKRLKSKKNRGS